MKTYGLKKNYNESEINLTKYDGWVNLGSKKLAHKKAAYKKMMHRHTRRTVKIEIE